MLEILFNILLLKMLNIDLIIAMISMIAGLLAVWFTYNINKKIDNFDNYQYEFAKDLLREILPEFKKVCNLYIDEKGFDQLIISIFPIDTILVIMNLTTQSKELLHLKTVLSALIMHINKSNYLIKEINLNKDSNHFIILKKEFIKSLNILKNSITEFQEKFLE